MWVEGDRKSKRHAKAKEGVGVERKEENRACVGGEGVKERRKTKARQGGA